MTRLTLWVLDASPPSWAIRMLGEILGLEFELKTIDFVGLEHKSQDFLKRNPMGTVPVLEDGDFTISESHTIMKYLLEKYGKKAQQESLYPSELKARAFVDQALYFDTGVAFIKVKLIALPSIFQDLQGLTPSLIQQTEEVYGIVDDYLNRNRYVAADHVTLADLSLGATIVSLDSVLTVDATKFPRTLSWLNKLREEPYFKKVAVPGAVVMNTIVTSSWERNKQKK